MTDADLIARIRANPAIHEELAHLEDRAAEAMVAAVVAPQRWKGRADLRADLLTLLTREPEP